MIFTSRRGSVIPLLFSDFQRFISRHIPLINLFFSDFLAHVWEMLAFFRDLGATACEKTEASGFAAGGGVTSKTMASLPLRVFDLLIFILHLHVTKF